MKDILEGINIILHGVEFLVNNLEDKVAENIQSTQEKKNNF